MLQVFLGILRHHALEYLAAAGLIMIASAALVVQRSVVSSGEDEVHGLAHDLGPNMLVVSEDADLEDVYGLQAGDAVLPDRYADSIRASDIAAHVRGIEESLHGDVAVDRELVSLVGLRQGPSRGAPRNGRHHRAVLGQEAATLLARGAGDTLELGSAVLDIEGIAEQAPLGAERAVLTTLVAAQGILERPSAVHAMRLSGCWCRIDVPALGAEVESLLPGSRAITASGVLEAQTGTVEATRKTAGNLRIVAIVVIAALTAALIHAQIRRHRREIGLLLAIGAYPWQVTLAFTAAGVLLGVIGGLAGFALGHPAALLSGTWLLGEPLAIPPGSFGPVWITTTLACSIGALIPAARVSELDPTEALREV